MSTKRGVDGPTEQAREAGRGPTRRTFADRRLLKVYLDAPDFEALAAAAREDGKAVSEYVRRLIADRLAAQSPVPATPEQRHRPRSRSTIRAIEDVAHEAGRDLPVANVGPLTRETPAVEPGRTCVHGTKRGFRC